MRHRCMNLKMTPSQPVLALDTLSDAERAVRLLFYLSWRRTVTAWLLVPFGLTCTLVACMATDRLIKLSAVSFPASVALLIALFFALIASQKWLGDKKTRAIVRAINVPATFALRYINVFFTPAFVLLPLSPSIGGIEVAKIIGVFLVGYAIVFAATAYFVRGLQVILGTSKRAIAERAEEMGAEQDSIPLNRPPNARSGYPSRVIQDEQVPLPEMPAPMRGTDRSYHESPSVADDADSVRAPVRQEPLPPTRAQEWATLANAHLDVLTYSSIFLFAGIPVYFSKSGYAMPAHLTLSVLAYLTAIAIPGKWKRFLHPVLVSSAITVAGIWVLALCRMQTLNDGLHEYSRSIKYVQIWNGQNSLPLPGAGDIFTSILDTSIVALAIPMFQYRSELRRNFAIVIPNITISILSIFGYPPICYAIGISSKRSLSFAVRSLTLALANPAIANLDGDKNLAAVICIMSGIIGVLVGPQMLKLLRVPEDDYVTRGVTLGANSSAIATALLLATDPRAAALSSLSMGLFGTATVALTSIPPVVQVVSSLVGL